MSENLLTVSALRTKVEAELIRAKLEAAGIAAVLFEPDNQADGTPPARVQVQVSPPDFERAMQLLFPIPQRAAPPQTDKPPWKCPQCGEQVLGQFPRCWKCGTAREGSPAPSIAPPVTLAASTSPTGIVPPHPLPPMPAPPLLSSPMPSGPQPMTGFAAAPRVALRGGPSQPELEIPPAPPIPAVENKPATNGESPLKAAPMRSGMTRSAEDEGLKIVVPAWDASTGKAKSDRASANKSPSDADDRAACRAWWTAVIGLVCPPLLIYSIIVVLVLGLTNRQLSARGSRFFYGALVVNAAIMAVAFAWLGTRR
jgi:hypothetical protein